MRLLWRAVEDLFHAAHRAGGYIGRHFLAPEETAFENLPVWRRYGGALPLANDEKRDVIARKEGKMREQSMKLRAPFHNHAGLLKKLAFKRGFGGFAPLDTAAREMPPRTVGMAHKQYTAVPGDNGALCTEGCAPG